MIPYAAGVIVPLALTLLVRNAKKDKKRGVVVDDVGGEPGHTVRNHRFKDPVSSHWEDISTLPELFEISCKNHSYRFSLGTRRLIAREVETSKDGKVFEKLHLVIMSARHSGRRLKLCVVLLLVWFRLDTSRRNVSPFLRI